MKISIMQPAFLPPASYFRLFATTDLFVIYDNVQFNRRWYTHRQRLTRKDRTKDWLTLPLAKMPQTALINQMAWAGDYQERWLRMVKKFRYMQPGAIPSWQTPLMFVCNSLFNACEALKIPLNVKLASEIPTPIDLHGQDRILYICQQMKADTYVNSPGGKALYDVGEFSKRGIALEFLPESEDRTSILERLALEYTSDVRREIYDNI